MKCEIIRRVSSGFRGMDGGEVVEVGSQAGLNEAVDWNDLHTLFGSAANGVIWSDGIEYIQEDQEASIYTTTVNSNATGENYFYLTFYLSFSPI